MHQESVRIRIGFAQWMVGPAALARAGFLLNLATIASVTLLAPLLLRLVFG